MQDATTTTLGIQLFLSSSVSSAGLFFHCVVSLNQHSKQIHVFTIGFLL